MIAITIGDWVYNKHHKKNIQITPFDYFTHGHLPSGRQYLLNNPELVSGRDFEPIPLTEEILEKNDFNLVADNVYIYYNSAGDGYIKIRLCNLYDGEWELYVDNYDKLNDSHFTFSIDRSFLKLHELQHALRLCKIEKEIEL